MSGSTIMPLMFAPVARESAASACAGRVRAAILRGELAPGERLPPERDLAASFGVNRGTLRAALRELELGGLLSVLHGSGYSVKDFRQSGGPALVPAIAELAKESGDFAGVAADLLLVRRALAAVLLERLAAQRLSRPGLRAIEDAVAAFAELAATTPRASTAALAEADMRVVHALVAATESAVLGLFVNPIASILERLPELREAIYAEPAENAAAYRAVVEGLKQGALQPAPGAAAFGAGGVAASALEARDQATLTRLRAGQRPQGAAARRSR